jgi:altronate dehydratase small subunit
VFELKQKAVILNSRDNVATSLAYLKAGDTLELEVSGETRAIKLTGDVPFGHKFSLSRIEPNSPVIKYGEVIGMSTATIKPGDYVHTNNVVSTRGRGDLPGGLK